MTLKDTRRERYQAGIANQRAGFEGFGGPDRDRTDDLFHAMEARSQLRHRPTCCGDATLLLSPLEEVVSNAQARTNRDKTQSRTKRAQAGLESMPETA